MHASRSRTIRVGRFALVASVAAALVMLTTGFAPGAGANPRFGHHGPPSFVHHGWPNNGFPGHGGCFAPPFFHGHGAFDHTEVRFEWLPGYDDPSTPNNLDRVGVLEVGPVY